MKVENLRYIFFQKIVYKPHLEEIFQYEQENAEKIIDNLVLIYSIY